MTPAQRDEHFIEAGLRLLEALTRLVNAYALKAERETPSIKVKGASKR